MKRYLILWKKFGQEKFTFKEAQEILNEDARIVSLFLSELNKAGWLKSVELHPEDARMRIYQLKNYKKIFEEVVKKEVSV